MRRLSNAAHSLGVDEFSPFAASRINYLFSLKIMRNLADCMPCVSSAADSLDGTHAKDGGSNAFPAAKSGSRRRIGLMLFRHGARQREELPGVVHGSLAGHKSNTLRAIDQMVSDGQLIARDGLLDIPASTRTDYALLSVEAARAEKKPALVPPAAPVPFKPLSARFIPSLRGPRDCEAREFHPVSMSSRVRGPCDGKGEA